MNLPITRSDNDIIHYEPKELASIREKMLELTIYYEDTRRNKKRTFWLLIAYIPLSIVFGVLLSGMTLMSVNYSINNSNGYTFSEFFKLTIENWLNPKFIINNEKQEPPNVTIQPQAISVQPASVSLIASGNKPIVIYKKDGGFYKFYNPNKNIDAVIKLGYGDNLINIPYSSNGTPTSLKYDYQSPTCLNCELQIAD